LNRVVFDSLSIHRSGYLIFINQLGPRSGELESSHQEGRAQRDTPSVIKRRFHYLTPLVVFEVNGPIAIGVPTQSGIKINKFNK
jgi:hypothetical protein